MDHPSIESAQRQISIHERHLNELTDGGGILSEVVRERGYRSISDGAELQRLGFARSQLRAPGMLVPFWGVNGEVASHQFKPDLPLADDKEKKVKYETPAGSRNRLDCPPRCRVALSDTTVPLYITEGVKETDALASRQLCAVGLTGAWSWRGRTSWQ